MAVCRACKDWCEGKSKEERGKYWRCHYCLTCWEELTEGRIPNVTGPSYAPTGTGQVPRQQIKRGHTGG